MTINTVIGFIGGGNMAKAIAKGILKKGIVRNSQIIVSALSNETLQDWADLSVQTTLSNAEVVQKSDIVILAVKPQHLDCVVHSLEKESYQSKLVVSILAGASSDKIFKKLSFIHGVRVIRVMPNTLMLICEGCSAIASHSSAKPEDVKIVKEIFSALGKCEIVPEYLIPAITGLSGSGPAYVYLVIEALSDGGVQQGLPREIANAFAAQTVLGAAKMVLETQKHTSQLKDEVCSAGGTTIHGLHALEKGCLRGTLMNAVQAAVNRANEMSKLNDT